MAATIESWLIALDLERYREVFAANDVDLRAVPHLTDADLRELGISLGHRRIILAAAAELNASEATRTQGRSSEPPPGKDAEFRVLSILFCDLVGSTQLSQRLDPEAMRDLLRRYQDAVAGAVTRYQGHLAKYLGDGVLAYFGWPVAHEDHAERAVRAGREALQAVAAIRHCDAERLAARVGIATGQVIVGDLVGESGREEAAVAGETANLAARIQSAAFPGQLLVAAETARLVGGMFDLEDLGLRELKGFEHPWQLLLVRGERAVESRFEATRGGSARALVGRVHELGNLTERWAIAREGRGQAIQIVGEAGIGKSRLIEAFLEQLGVGQQDVIRLQCSPYHTSSSLYPVIERLRRLAGFAADDEPGDRARKLARMAADVHDDLPTVMPLFAELLSVDVGPAYPSIDLPPAELKERILDLLTARLVRLAARMPLFIILEDAHWIDPSTEELLSRILRRMDQLPVMLAITHRPDWQAAWSEEAAVATIPLGRLDRDQIAALMAGILGRHPTERLVDRVLDRTDGVPLFVEELTRALAEAAATETDESASIPLTIQASLMSRLDRLHPSARATALVASVIGREFDAQLLREVTGSSTDEIEDALDQLQRARLIVSTGSHADGFSFRHALIQETAYRALLAPKRRHNHARIADALARRADIVETQPEMVARHWTEAGQGERALAFWHRAARRSLARAANHEAVDQSERALTIAGGLTDAESRERELLAARLLYGTALANVGRLSESLPPLQSAVDGARRLGNDLAYREAVLELDTAYFLLGGGEQNVVALLQNCLAEADKADDRIHCLLHGRLARAMLLASDLEGAAEHNRAASRLARKLGNRSLLLDVLVNDFLMPASARPMTLMAHWRERVDELYALAETGGDDALGRAVSIDVYVSAEMGDRGRMDAALERLAEFGEERQRMHVQWIATHGFAMRAIMCGDFLDAERHAERGWELGHRTHGSQFEGVYGIQMFAIRREQGRLAEVAPVIKHLIDRDPSQSAWKPGFALIASDLGFREPARRLLDELAAGDFVFPLDAKHSTTLAYLAEVCAALEDRRHAERLYDLLLPYRQMTVTAGVTTLCYGAAGRFLGSLAAVLGDWAAAEGHFEQALVLNDGLGAPVWLAHTQHDHAAMLHRRGRTGDLRRAEKLIESALETALRLDMVRLKRALRSFVQ